MMKQTSKIFDVIVVGSGPGGASVAKELARMDQSVLILERGDNNPVKGTITQMVPQAMVPGKGLLVTHEGLGMVRGITTGGSSQFYCATVFDPPFDRLKKHGVDITGEVAEIRREIPNAPLTDVLMSPAGACFEHSAMELGYDCHRLNKMIFQDQCLPDCQRCLYGCPVGAKWSARNFVNEAVENGASIINGARVNRVIIENKAAVGVEYQHRHERHQVFAAKVIVAAGGIGSPMILRKSGLAGAGYDFFFDPLIFVMGTVKSIHSGKGIAMCAGVHFEEDGIVMTDFNMPRLLKLMFDVGVFRFSQIFSYAGVVPIMIKVRDRLGGKVINDRMIWKGLAKSDKQKIDKGVIHARRILKHAGASDVYRSWYLATHPGGTAKIGEIVDANLKTEYDDLYVCDCSVLPEESGLPPTMILLALGKRLARHLMKSADMSMAR
jgi:choline dehydrogenase-like flavoprotein